MKKIILFTLFFMFFTVTGYAVGDYSETIFKYKYNKKTEKNSPIEFIKIIKNNNKYELNYKLKGQIPSKNAKEKINVELPFSYIDEVQIKDNFGNFICKGSYKPSYHSFEDKYEKNIIFTFIFDNDHNYKIHLSTVNEINIDNPIKISYKYNEYKKSFDVIQTILYIDEKGELKTKDVEITNSASDVITLKTETLSTEYYIKLREEEERIAEEKRKQELKEQRKREEKEEKERKIEEEKKKKKLSVLAQKMKNWQNVSKYSEEDIVAVFRDHFDGILTSTYSIHAILNVEKNKNIWLPMPIIQVLPNEGFICTLGNSYNAVYVQYKYTDGFLSGYPVEVYAKIVGTYTYQNTRGGTNTVPKLKAYYVQKRVFY